MVSLCQQPTTGHLHVIILKAMGLPAPKSEAPGSLGKTTCSITHYVNRAVSIECHKTKIKVNALANHNRRKRRNEPIRPQLLENRISLFLDNSLSSAVNILRLMLLARYLHRPMIHILLPSFCIRFIWLYRVFPTYFIHWIAAYPEINAIHPLNNWSQNSKQIHANGITRGNARGYALLLIGWESGASFFTNHRGQ